MKKTAALALVAIAAGTVAGCSGHDEAAQPAPAPSVTASATPAGAPKAPARREPSATALEKALQCDQTAPRDEVVPDTPESRAAFLDVVACSWNSGSAVLAVRAADTDKAQTVVAMMKAQAREQAADMKVTRSGAWVFTATDSAARTKADAAYVTALKEN